MSIKKMLKPHYHKFKNAMKFYKRFGLKNKSVSIISNNCGGGFISQHFGLPYNSPTAGLFFDSEDYVKFAKNPKHYFESELVFINPQNSKYYDKYKPTYPVAQCDDIEIFFMHYPTEQEAESKWKRRARRVDFNNCYVLLFENNSTKKEHLLEFDKISLPHKALIFSDYCELKHCVRNFKVLNHPNHHWLPEYVIESCNWKNVFNNLNK